MMDSKYDQFQINYDDVDVKKEAVQSLNINDSTCENQDEFLLELGMFSVCDSMISDNSNNLDKNDYVFSVDDLNNVSKNDLLFTNTDCYENILSDNDLLNSFSENVNFYNETVTLYGNDNNKELLFDCGGNLPSLDLVSSENFCKSTGNSELSTNDAFIESIAMTENLENIVPNLNVFTNNNLEYNNENNSNNHLLQPEYKIIEDANLSNCKDFSIESSVTETIKTPAISFNQEENFDPNEFLNFKPSKITNSSTNNNNIDFNSFVKTPKENVLSISLKNSKLLSPSLTLLNDKSKPVVPAKKFKNMNGIATTTLYIKQSDINELKNLTFLNKSSNKALHFNNSKLKLKEKCNIISLLKKPTVTQFSKAAQTTTKIKNTEDVFDNLQAVEDENHSFVRECTEKIKKPKFYDNAFIFNFSAECGTLFTRPYTEDDFGKDNDRVYYYTGLPKYSYFMALLNCLTLPNNHVITPFQMLLLTLMKLRLNLDWTDLAYRFGKSIQTAKETFGITLFILSKCLSCIVQWPMDQYKTAKYCSRIGMNLYVYGIKLNINSCPKINKTIFVCLSTLRHPIHFVSRPILESDCSDRMDILAISGIKEGLALRDNIIFDEEIDSLSATGNRSCISMSSKTQSLCSKPFDNSLGDIDKLKDTVNEIKKFKYIYEEIKCCWEDEPKGEFLLYNNAVKVVCGLVNLCHVLPFCNSAVKSIIKNRKSLEILIR